MAGFRDCVDTVRRASGMKISDAEAVDILEKVGQRFEALQAEGRIGRTDAELARLARGDADKVLRTLILRRKHAALIALRRDGIDRHMERFRAAGRSSKDAILALLHGLEGRVEGIRKSVWATKSAYEGRYLGGIMSRIAKERPHLEARLKDEALNERIALEMEQLDKPRGRPGITGDADALFLAKLYAEYGEVSRRDLNAAGADIGKRAGWTPHTHDPMRLTRAGANEWIDFLLPRLDTARTFEGMNNAEIRASLAETWRTLVTGRDMETRDAALDAAGTVTLAEAHGQSRELHFRSTRDWLDYNREFGHGTVTASMFRHLTRAARDAGTMDILGPDPLGMLRQVADDAALSLRDDPALATDPGKAKAARKEVLQLQKVESWAATRIMTGEASQPVNMLGARVGEGIRVWQSLSKLGAVLLSSLPDALVLANNLRFHGKPFLEAYRDVAAGFFKGRGKGEARELAFLLGEGYDGLIDHMISPHLAEDGGIGAASRLSMTFYRWTGLTGWTDIGRAAGARIMAADMGRHAATDHAGLPERYRHVLGLHGIDAARWGVLRLAASRGSDGTPRLAPDAVGRLPLARFLPLVQDQIDALPKVPAESGTRRADQVEAMLQRARLDLEMDVRRFYADEIAYGILEADDRQRKVTTGGLASGTLAGEAMRTFMQLKGYPTGFTMRVLGRGFKSGPRGATRGETILKSSRHIGELMATLFVSGLLAVWMKDLARGQSPKELVGDDGVNLKTIAAAMVQSGGMGIYGDFLFAEASRFGKSPLETFTGPAVGELGRLADILLKAKGGEARGSELTGFAASNTPFLNLFYVRPAVDLLFLNSLRDAMSPGFLRRQEQRIREDYGQDYILPREAF